MTLADEKIAEELTEEAAEREDTAEETAEQEEPNLTEQLAAQTEQYMRLAAEYDNFRRRSAKEREALSRLVKADTVAELLPVADNLKRALEAGGPENDLRKGLALTMQQLEAGFEKLGVCAFAEPGEPFDPNLHDAMQHVESEDFGENTLSAVFQQGYKIGETVIRHASVVVAN